MPCKSAGKDTREQSQSKGRRCLLRLVVMLVPPAHQVCQGSAYLVAGPLNPASLDQMHLLICSQRAPPTHLAPVRWQRLERQALAGKLTHRSGWRGGIDILATNP